MPNNKTKDELSALTFPAKNWYADKSELAIYRETA
jgi:hypothetical protein